METDFENNTRYIRFVDERRILLVPGNKEATLAFAAEHFINVAKESIEQKNSFSVALSGGSTPQAIFNRITQPPLFTKIDWTKVKIFWSDERSVPPTHSESNYGMAMKAGFSSVPIPEHQIFRMHAENSEKGEIEKQAHLYEQQLTQTLTDGTFDLVMLGMGEDGHTASLFPETHGLHTEGRLVIANYVPKLETWRMTLTFDCINQAKQAVIYVLGQSKSQKLKEIFSSPYNPDHLPVQKIGSSLHKALFIADENAADEIKHG